MTCFEPGTVDQESLLALAMGEPNRQTADHVASCPACAARVAAYAWRDRVLHARLFRAACPSSLDLGELALGLLEPHVAQPIRAHLAECDSCAAESRTLTASLAGDCQRDLMTGPSGLRRLLARLAPAPAVGFALAGVRGGGHDQPMTYEADDVTISLASQAGGHGSGRRWALLGLLDVAGMPPPTGTAVVLTADGGDSWSVKADEVGNFAFEALLPDLYRLDLRLEDREVGIEQIIIGEAGP